MLVMSGIDKTFGSNQVLQDVSFDLKAGEVHALLGENGAGKSTLMNILTGIYAADAGSIMLDDKVTPIQSPADALSMGIGMVHQHFRLVPVFTGWENIQLAAGNLPDLAPKSILEERVEKISQQVGFTLPLDRPVRTLAIADRQRIEILKPLVLGARTLLMDDPTAVLTDEESERLLDQLRDLAHQNYGVVLITHKLREVMRASDRVAVLRQGRVVLSGASVSAIDQAGLSEAMIGAPAVEQPDRTAREFGDVLLKVSGLDLPRRSRVSVNGTTLAVRAGSITGIAGVGGNGQQELADGLVGLMKPTNGTIQLADKDVTHASVWERRRLGLRYIPSDRGTSALSGGLSIAENLAAATVRAGQYGSIFVPFGKLAEKAVDAISKYAIAGAEPARPVRLLSGGNAQKVVLARELDDAARVIIAHSPTRGLDVAACQFVHDELVRAATRGAAVVLISEDIEEILALSDHIFVMSRGQLASTENHKPDRRQIGELMLGHV